MKLVSKWIAACALLALAPQARAQSADAEALFQEGRKLIKLGKLAAGCDKLAASEKLESSVGTLLNLGDCREKMGKLATAWAAFRKAEAICKRAGDDERREAEARKRAIKLEPRLESLVVEVPHRVEGLTVRRDGEVLDIGAWNTALPIDSGTYTIVATAPGYLPWHATVDVNGKRAVVRVPALERDQPVQEPTWAMPPAQPAKAQLPHKPVIVHPTPTDSRLVVDPAPAPAPEARAPEARIELRQEPGTWSGTRVVAAGFALAGVAGLGTGLYFGLQSRDLQSRADERCPRATCADPYGLALNADAQTAAHRANVMYIAGGATAALAAVLWLVGAPSVTPSVGEHHAGVAFARRF